MNAKRLLALLTALAMIFGSSCFAVLWMGVVGRVSGWTGLPQYESQIPKLQWYGTLWESLGIAFLFIAAFVLGLGKRVTANDVPPAWSTLLFSFLGRLGLCIIGAVAFVFLLGVIPRFHTS